MRTEAYPCGARTRKSTTRIQIVLPESRLRGARRAAAEGLLSVMRGHWTVENRLRWVRDVTFDEDRSQVRRRNGPQDMAALRNLAISVLCRAGHNPSAKPRDGATAITNVPRG